MTTSDRVSRVLLAAFAALAALHLVGILLDAPGPWQWSGPVAALALAGYAAFGTTGTRPVVRWSLVSACALVAAWPVMAMRMADSAQVELYVYLAPLGEVEPLGDPASSALDALWHGLLRNGQFLLTMGCLALAIVAMARSDPGQLPVRRAGVVATATAGVLGLGYAFVAISDRAGSGPERSVLLRHLMAAVSGDLLLMLAAVVCCAIAARKMWYAAAGMALLAGYAVAGLAGALDQERLDLWAFRVPPGNTAAPQLFLEPGMVYTGPSPVPVSPVLHTAVALASIALVVVGCVRARRIHT